MLTNSPRQKTRLALPSRITDGDLPYGPPSSHLRPASTKKKTKKTAFHSLARKPPGPGIDRPIQEPIQGESPVSAFPTPSLQNSQTKPPPWKHCKRCNHELRPGLNWIPYFQVRPNLEMNGNKTSGNEPPPVFLGGGGYFKYRFLGRVGRCQVVGARCWLRFGGIGP